MGASNQGRKQVFAAVTFCLTGQCVRYPSFQPNLLGFLKGIRCDNGPFGPIVAKMILFRQRNLLPGEKVLNFIFVINQDAAIDGIHENPTNTPGIPIPAELCFVPVLVQNLADASAPQPLPGVQGKNTAYYIRFHGVDFQRKIVNPIVAEQSPGNTAFFCVYSLTPFDTLGKIIALLLGHGAEQGQYKLTVSHGIHIRR